jgi:hypothetical protein
VRERDSDASLNTQNDESADLSRRALIETHNAAMAKQMEQVGACCV